MCICLIFLKLKLFKKEKLKFIEVFFIAKFFKQNNKN